MNKFHVSLLAVICVSVSLNADDALKDLNNGYTFFVKGKGAPLLVHVASSKCSVVDQVPGAVTNNKFVQKVAAVVSPVIKKKNVDRALMHFGQKGFTFLTSKGFDATNPEHLKKMLQDGGKDAGISLLLGGVANTLERYNVPSSTGNEYADGAIYSVLHWYLRTQLDKQLNLERA